MFQLCLQRFIHILLSSMVSQLLAVTYLFGSELFLWLILFSNCEGYPTVIYVWCIWWFVSFVVRSYESNKFRFIVLQCYACSVQKRASYLRVDGEVFSWLKRRYTFIIRCDSFYISWYIVGVGRRCIYASELMHRAICGRFLIPIWYVLFSWC